MADGPYAGDLSPKEAWDLLAREPGASLIDVRTEAEWAYVGLPDTTPLGKATHRVSWQAFPAMAINPAFADQIATIAADKTQPILFLCRSGARSRDAAIALTRLGYKRCYNVAEGFEGSMDSSRHRGSVSGWKVAGLPWKQS